MAHITGNPPEREYPPLIPKEFNLSIAVQNWLKELQDKVQKKTGSVNKLRQ